jgi:hypothetical protein
LLVQQHEGLAEALTTATGEDNQGVGWMGGIGSPAASGATVVG